MAAAANDKFPESTVIEYKNISGTQFRVKTKRELEAFLYQLERNYKPKHISITLRAAPHPEQNASYEETLSFFLEETGPVKGWECDKGDYTYMYESATREDEGCMSEHDTYKTKDGKTTDAQGKKITRGMAMANMIRDFVGVPAAAAGGARRKSRKATRKASRKATRKASRKASRKGSRKATRKATRKARKASRKARKASRKNRKASRKNRKASRKNRKASRKNRKASRKASRKNRK